MRVDANIKDIHFNNNTYIRVCYEYIHFFTSFRSIKKKKKKC